MLNFSITCQIKYVFLCIVILFPSDETSEKERRIERYSKGLVRVARFSTWSTFSRIYVVLRLALPNKIFLIPISNMLASYSSLRPILPYRWDFASWNQEIVIHALSNPTIRGRRTPSEGILLPQIIGESGFDLLGHLQFLCF